MVSISTLHDKVGNELPLFADYYRPGGAQELVLWRTSPREAAFGRSQYTKALITTLLLLIHLPHHPPERVDVARELQRAPRGRVLGVASPLEQRPEQRVVHALNLDEKTLPPRPDAHREAPPWRHPVARGMSKPPPRPRPRGRALRGLTTAAERSTPFDRRAD